MTATRAATLAPPRRTAVVWLSILSALYVGDVVDVAVLAYAAPAIRADWDLSIGAIGLLTALSFLGMFLGAIVGGWVSDHIGRKRTIILATFVAGTFSLVSAIAPNLAVLGLCRVCTGLGLQAVTGVLIVYVVEMFPAHSRGRYQAIMLGAGVLGVPLTALLARLIVPSGESTWRWLFVFGAFGILPALIALVALPESARWQEVREQRDQPTRRDTSVLREGNPRRVVVASLVMVFGILGYYGFHSWVPTLLVEKGHTTTAALTITSVYAFAPVLGCLAALPVIDRWERTRLSLVICLCVAGCMVVFAFAQHTWLVVAAGFLVNLLLQINTTVVYTYLPEAFPTSVRGLSSGIANGVGRLAGLANGLIIPAIFASAGFAGVFVTTALCMALAGGILAVFGERKRISAKN